MATYLLSEGVTTGLLLAVKFVSLRCNLSYAAWDVGTVADLPLVEHTGAAATGDEPLSVCISATLPVVEFSSATTQRLSRT